MKKTLSYRDKLLELGRIYNISEIQNYIKRKKNLTTQQIEHILRIEKDLGKNIKYASFDAFNLVF